MKTFRLIGMALLAVVMCVNFASCSSDDDEEGSKSTLEQLQGIWYDSTDDYHYFIVEKHYCYFSNHPTTENYGEKYSYIFDSKTNTMQCTDYVHDSDEIWYIKIQSISDKKLVLGFSDDNQTIDEIREWVKIE